MGFSIGVIVRSSSNASLQKVAPLVNMETMKMVGRKVLEFSLNVCFFKDRVLLKPNNSASSFIRLTVENTDGLSGLLRCLLHLNLRIVRPDGH